MTTRDFLRMVLRVFGLYSLVVTLFSVLPGNIMMALSDIDLKGLLWSIGSVSIVFALFLFLIFKSDAIITRLKLDKGFDQDRIPFEKIDAPTILKLGSLIVGGLIFLENIPPFLTNGYVLLRASVESSMEDRMFGFNPMETKIYFAINLLSLVVGYLLLVNYKVVSRLLSNKE